MGVLCWVCWVFSLDVLLVEMVLLFPWRWVFGVVALVVVGLGFMVGG